MTKRKQKIITLSAVAAVAAMVVAGSTLAYFTDTKEAVNTFTMGDVSIKLDETDIDGEDSSRTETGNDYTEVVPGVWMTKDPVITNTGSQDAYVCAEVKVEGWLPLYKKYINSSPEPDDVKNSLTELVDELGEGWSIYGHYQDIETGDITFLLQYADILKSGEAAPAIFNKIKLPSAMRSGDEFGDVTIKGKAIQAAGFNNINEAIGALDSQLREDQAEASRVEPSSSSEAEPEP